MSEPQSVTDLVAFLTVKDGEESVILYQSPNTQIALVSPDPSHIPAMTEYAQEACEANGTELRIVQFSNRTDITQQILGDDS